MRHDFDSEATADRTERPKWERPSIEDFDVASVTEITNCGNGSDGVICQAAS